MKKAKRNVNKKSFVLLVNEDESFARTPKKGKLFLIVDNTRKLHAVGTLDNNNPESTNSEDKESASG